MRHSLQTQHLGMLGTRKYHIGLCTPLADCTVPFITGPAPPWWGAVKHRP